MTDLKPCPFCGGEAERIDTIDDGSFIDCTKCGCSSRILYDRKERLVSDWNQRYPTLWCGCGDSLTEGAVCENCHWIEVESAKENQHR